MRECERGQKQKRESRESKSPKMNRGAWIEGKTRENEVSTEKCKRPDFAISETDHKFEMTPFVIETLLGVFKPQLFGFEKMENLEIRNT